MHALAVGTPDHACLTYVITACDALEKGVCLTFTHAAHFDIDEYLQLNKHENVRDFVKEYLTDEHGILDKKCGAITMNWVFAVRSTLARGTPRFGAGTSTSSFDFW